MREEGAPISLELVAVYKCRRHDTEPQPADQMTLWSRDVANVSFGDYIFEFGQWRRYRGFRRFNEPGPPSSWGGPERYNMIFYVTCNMEK